MPFFETVGHIDDDLSAAEVKKEYRRRYSINKYYTKRAAIVAELGGKCAVCSSTEDLIFVRKQGAPRFRVGQMTGMSDKTVKKLLKHVELMCADHARKALYNKDQMTHGTWFAAYKKKCNCEDCGEFKADYRLRRREDRRDAKKNK